MASLGTNAGSQQLPFQTWHHFKEAYTPELVAHAIAESHIRVRSCLDPFGGSGTTALTCQFLGVEPRTIEVNPYLADLIEAKLLTYDPDALAADLGRVLRTAVQRDHQVGDAFPGAPPTFVEPGVNERWIFDRAVARKIVALLSGISSLQAEHHRRFFRVVLGGILISISNVVVNGKGRRYRHRWQERPVDPESVIPAFRDAAENAAAEALLFRDRPCLSYRVYRSDCRKALPFVKSCDLAVFSPPYPNSFDYTDVYNVELWTLGYLDGADANRRLRRKTLSSHVQIIRPFQAAPQESSVLARTVRALRSRRSDLWESRIPEMIGAYFAEMRAVLASLYHKVEPGGAAWIVVGDSKYSDVHVPSAAILAELAPAIGWKAEEPRAFRSMRGSAQSGGKFELAESLLVLHRT